MVHKKTHLVVVTIFLAITGVTFAGDAARFVNLGFSRDSRVFVFGQYGITYEENLPFAEIFAVDVPRNVFVQDGVFSRTFQTTIGPGQDGIGALYNLLPDAEKVIQRYGVDHLNQGRLIYLLVNGAAVREQIEFRDFETGNSYTIKLVQSRRTNGEHVQAAFYLDVTTRLADGSVVNHRVGRPDYFRDDIDRYRIKQIVASPNERSVVAVIERIRETGEGMRIRYMVETVQLR